MVWIQLTEGLRRALETVGLYTPERLARLELSIPRDPSHGDWTTNLAMVLAREARRPPRTLAESLAAAFPRDAHLFESVEVAGPGFLNFRYAPEFLDVLPGRIRSARVEFGRSAGGAGVAVQVEYVSANPTGPLNVVNARAAAVGATLVRLLNAVGYHASGEFYVNDAGGQVEILGESMATRFAERIGVARPFPEQGYRGAYVAELAAELPEAEARAALERPDAAAWFRDQALERMVAWQARDLAAYGAEFARWFKESELHASGAVGDTLAALEARGMLYRAKQPEVAPVDRPIEREEEPDELGEATFLRTSHFGDDTDRVVVKSNGVPTYLLPDVAYHRDKRARGFRHVIDLWGPDHHGYVPRMKAALLALGLEPDFLEVLTAQQVNLLAGGQPVRMSKRAENSITLRELIDEVGPTPSSSSCCARPAPTSISISISPSARTTRIPRTTCNTRTLDRLIPRFAAERGLTPSAAAAGASANGGSLYPAAEERALLRKLAAFPEVVRGAALVREPHRLPTYLMETAGEFHRFYHACRVVSEDMERSRVRLELADAARQVLHNGLALMGVTAPERMDRVDPTP